MGRKKKKKKSAHFYKNIQTEKGGLFSKRDLVLRANHGTFEAGNMHRIDLVSLSLVEKSLLKKKKFDCFVYYFVL